MLDQPKNQTSQIQISQGKLPMRKSKSLTTGETTMTRRYEYGFALLPDLHFIPAAEHAVNRIVKRLKFSVQYQAEN